MEMEKHLGDMGVDGSSLPYFITCVGILINAIKERKNNDMQLYLII